MGSTIYIYICIYIYIFFQWKFLSSFPFADSFGRKMMERSCRELNHGCPTRSWPVPSPDDRSTVWLAPMLFKYATRQTHKVAREINATARARSRRTTSERASDVALASPGLVSEAFMEPFEPPFRGSKGRTRVTYSHDRHDVFHYDSADGHPSCCSSFANFELSGTRFPRSRTFDKDVVGSSLRFVKLDGQQINANLKCLLTLLVPYNFFLLLLFFFVCL